MQDCKIAVFFESEQCFFVSLTLSPIKKNENIFFTDFFTDVLFFYVEFSEDLKTKSQSWQVLPPHSFECSRSCAIRASKSASGSQFSSTYRAVFSRRYRHSLFSE